MIFSVSFVNLCAFKFLKILINLASYLTTHLFKGFK